MKQLSLFLLFVVLTCCSLGQEETFDPNKFSFQGLDFSASKQELMNKLGEPDSIREPKYDCGGFSEGWYGRKYFQKFYGDMIFIGNDTVQYVPEKIIFTDSNKISFAYDTLTIDFRTTLQLLKRTFNARVKEFEDGTVFLSVELTHSDDGVIFVFHGSRLVEFRYWTPC